MPTLSTLQAFADTVESNDHVGAIEKFYAPDAITRENDQPPIVGRDALAEKERRVLASVASVKTTRLGPPLLDGDHSAIRWRFEFTAKDGSKRVMEEVAWQTLARREIDRGAVFLRSRDDEESVSRRSGRIGG